MPDKVEKFAELVYKSKAKMLMHSHTSDYCVSLYNIEILNPFDLKSQLINNKLVVKNKFKDLVEELKLFKIRETLILEYKKSRLT